MSQRTVEEYLESIGALEEQQSPVSTSSIAQIMGLSLASVSEMVRRLSEKGLVEYTPYGGAKLTDEGRKRFLRLTRRHRLWEVFLNKYLDIGWEDVYLHACNLEHATTDLVVQKLAAFLGNPRTCPHGSPIPGSNLKHSGTHGTAMANLEVGQSARMLSVIVEQNSDFLRYLTSLGLKPGTRFKILEKAPYDGTMTIQVNNTTKAISREAASLVMVKPLDKN
jgi:DtxR family Mn-dependent transcriptional regulator